MALNRRVILAVAVAAIASILFVRTAQYERQSRQPPAEISVSHAALDIVLPEVQFKAAPLDEAIRHLSSMANVRVQVDWLAFRIDEASPVSLHLYDAPLHGALELAIKQGPLPHLVHVVCVPRDGGIFLTSQEALASGALELCMYDVADLGARSLGQRPGQPEQPGFETFNGRVYMVGWCIREYVDPDSWDIPAGGPSSLSILQGRLFIVQTAGNHRLIERLLHNLRQVQSARAAESTVNEQPIDLLKAP